MYVADTERLCSAFGLQTRGLNKPRNAGKHSTARGEASHGAIKLYIMNIVSTFFLIIGMIILTAHTRRGDGETNRHFLTVIAVISLLLVFDTWAYALGQKAELNMLRCFTTAVGYTLQPVAVTVLTRLMFRDRSRRPWLWLPPAVLAIFALTNQYTHWLCYFSDDNHWQGGALRYLPHFIPGICFVPLAVETVKRQKEYKSEADPLFYFIVVINTIAAIAETRFNIKFLLTGTMTISCLFYYSLINKQNEVKRAIEHEQEPLQFRVSIMLSQIRPHFLFNSLTSMRRLCKNDPNAAQSAIDEFAKYLRGNLDSIKRSTPAPFTKELEHIRICLYLEKMRVEDDFRIVWDIQTEGFMLPAVTGDGVGHDTSDAREDGRTHTGIENIRQRLAVMCGGRLTVDTAPGEGTWRRYIFPIRRCSYEGAVC